MIPLLLGGWQKYLIYAGIVVGAFVVGNIRGCVNEKQHFAEYKAKVEALGRAQEAKNQEIIKRQKEESDARIKSLNSRLANTRNEFNRLRDSRTSELPAVPSTARADDDGTRDKQLLDLLQHAEEQTARLIELQEWVRESARIK